VERRARLAAGQSLTLDKFVAIVPDLDADDPVAAAQSKAQAAAAAGYAALRTANDAAWARSGRTWTW
jgi:trehalose/maltose hydrolase-like predicted phosphorylase